MTRSACRCGRARTRWWPSSATPATPSSRWACTCRGPRSAPSRWARGAATSAPPGTSTPATCRCSWLQSIAVRSSERSGGRVFGFSYNDLDKDGQRISVGPWGSRTKGQQRNISMNEDNYITFISGTYDDYGITSLKFESTQDDYAPSGARWGPPSACPCGTPGPSSASSAAPAPTASSASVPMSCRWMTS